VDERLRQLERAARAGDLEAAARSVVEAVRRGDIDPRLADCVQGLHRCVQTVLGSRAAEQAFGSHVQVSFCVDCRQAVIVVDERVPEQPREGVTYRGHLVMALEDVPGHFEKRLRAACGHWWRVGLPKWALARCDGPVSCGNCARTTRRALVRDAAPSVYAWLLERAKGHTAEGGLPGIGLRPRRTFVAFDPRLAAGDSLTRDDCPINSVALDCMEAQRTGYCATHGWQE
jgi:hypothetical protein